MHARTAFTRSDQELHREMRFVDGESIIDLEAILGGILYIDNLFII